jgi:hypothetical protein
MEQLKHILLIIVSVAFLFSCVHKTELINIPEPLPEKLTEPLPIPESELAKIIPQEKIDTTKRIVVDNRDGHITDLPSGVFVAWPQDEYKKIVANLVRFKEIEKLAQKLEEENRQLVIVINDMTDSLKMERLLRAKTVELHNLTIAQLNEMAKQNAWLKTENAIMKIGIVGAIVFLAVSAL